MTSDEFIVWLHKEVESYGSQKALADSVGVSRSYICDILKGRREPGEAMLKRLGIRKTVHYTQIQESGTEAPGRRDGSTEKSNAFQN